MLSITGISAGQASDYYNQKDNYYIKQHGEWSGKGAELLGLVGDIQKDDFENALSGKNKDGAEIVSVGGESRSHRAGLDMTFSAPKSASILSEVCGDESVTEAHRQAVDATLGHIEEHYAQARQTENGQTERVNTGNLVIAKFEHDTSRELDPQLHTHAVILNMTQRQDGEWRAISNEELYRQKMCLGQYYRNELAANLREIGYEIQSDHKGLFEVKGVDKELREHFSQRSGQIETRLQEVLEKYPNADESKLREIAALGSRASKHDVDPNAVREAWNERLQEHGYTKEAVQESAYKATEQTHQVEKERLELRLNEYDYIRIATKDITENESIFSKEDVLRNAGRLSIGEYRNQDLERAFDELRQDKEIIQLDRNIFTTHEMLKIEKEILKTVEQGRNRTESISTLEKAQEGLREYEQAKGFTLTEDQRNAAMEVITSPDKYYGIQGDSGTGKSTLFEAVREQAENEGYDVKGFAYTGKASEELEQNSGIKSQTIDSFLAQETQQRFDKPQLWIVDEASEIGSRQMREIQKRAEAADAKVVFLGDIKQEQAISAGPAFEKMQKSGVLGMSELHEITRQLGDYKEISESLAAKKIDQAIEKLEKNGQIHEISDRNERIEAIVKDYTGLDDYRETIIVTARNDDRNVLNESIRNELKAQGRLDQKEESFTVRESKNLSPEDKHFAQSYQEGDVIFSIKAGVIGRAGSEGKVTDLDYENHTITVEGKNGKEYSIDLMKDCEHISVYGEKDQSFSEGDKVIFLKNDKVLEVKNGQSGTLEHIDEQGNMTVKMDSGKEVNFNIQSQYNYVDHGYAVTSYKSQGQTSEEVIYHADTGKEVNFNQAYVAITRGREDVTIYTDDKENLRNQMTVESSKSWSLDYETSQDVAKESESDKGQDIGRSEMNESFGQVQDDSRTQDQDKQQVHDIEM